MFSKRKLDHFTDEIINTLNQIQAADTARLPLTEYRHKIQFVENRIKAIHSVNWNRADELQELLTLACTIQG